MRVQSSGTTKHQVAVYEAQVAKFRAEVKSLYQGYTVVQIITHYLYMYLLRCKKSVIVTRN